MRLREEIADYYALFEAFFADTCCVPEFKPGDAFVDIGAHIGAVSAKAAHNGCRRVVAVEPDPENYALLAENLEALQSKWGGLFKALQGVVWLPGVHTAGLAKGPNSTQHRVGEGRPVMAYPLDSLLGIVGPVRFLKMDIEGDEWQVLRASESLARYVEELAVEVHCESDLKRLVPHLGWLGYATHVAPVPGDAGRFMLLANRRS